MSIYFSRARMLLIRCLTYKMKELKLEILAWVFLKSFSCLPVWRFSQPCRYSHCYWILLPIVGKHKIELQTVFWRGVYKKQYKPRLALEKTITQKYCVITFSKMFIHSLKGKKRLLQCSKRQHHRRVLLGGFHLDGPTMNWFRDSKVRTILCSVIRITT